MIALARTAPSDTSFNPASILEAPRVAAFSLTKLRLTGFRNYAASLMELDPRPVILTGANGAGKTNLLEAVSLLTPGRGLRRARVGELDQLGGTIPWAISATVNGPGAPVRLGTGRDPASDKRLVRIDGGPSRSQSQLGAYFSVVWLTPQMDRLFLDSAGERRRFLDRLVFGADAAHAGRVSAYEKALRQRAKLLKEGSADPSWLSALEAQMTERGIAVAAARLAMASRLNRACATGSGPFPGAIIAVDGQIEHWLETCPALEVEERFAAALMEERRQDAEAGGARTGPHRSDLAVTHVSKGLPAAQCSTGEQKALLIAVMLAHARLIAADAGAGPVLLLDEVAAHLDPERRKALFDTILGLGLQAWITGTDADVFKDLGDRAQHFAVDAATIKALN